MKKQLLVLLLIAGVTQSAWGQKKRVAVLDFCVNLGLALLLLRPLGAAGLVLASTVAIIVQTVLLKRALGRKVPELGFAPLWPSVGKVLAATAGMAVLVGGGWWGLRHFGPGGRVGDVLALCVLIPVGAAFYGWLPLYLPELFPTRVRATGQGICYNTGRRVAGSVVRLSGKLVETFACGTAAVVTPVGKVKSRDGEFTIGSGGPGQVTEALKARLTAIQRGQAPDTHGWVHRFG